MPTTQTLIDLSVLGTEPAEDYHAKAGLHPEGAKRSNNDIAKHVGVSHPTVAKYRAELEQQSTCKTFKSTKQAGGTGKEQSPPQDDPTPPERNDSKSKPVASRPRVGSDGRTINTAKIGKGASKGNRNGKGRVTVHFPHEAREAAERGQAFRVKTMINLELPTNHAPNCAYDLLSYFPYEYMQKVFREMDRIHQERQQKETAE